MGELGNGILFNGFCLACGIGDDFVRFFFLGRPQKKVKQKKYKEYFFHRLEDRKFFSSNFCVATFPGFV